MSEKAGRGDLNAVEAARDGDDAGGLEEEDHRGRAAAVEAVEGRGLALVADVGVDRSALAPADRERELAGEGAPLGVELRRQQLLHLLLQPSHLGCVPANHQPTCQLLGLRPHAHTHAHSHTHTRTHTHTHKPASAPNVTATPCTPCSTGLAPP
eukprot:2723682-Rhodomonas_salina.4